MIGENISLAQATPLEKTNAVFEKVIHYATNNSAFLENEGVFRLPGAGGTIDAKYPVVLKDPTSWSLEEDAEFTIEFSNVTGLLKRFVLTENQWSKEAAAILMLELESERELNNKINLDEVIQELIAKNHLEEAKMLHNALHLCHLIALKSDRNKMPAANMYQTIGPWLATMARGDEATFMKLAIEAAAATGHKTDPLGLGKTKPTGEPLYGKTFNESYPEAAQQLAQAHAEIPKRSNKKTFITIPTLFKKALDWTRTKAIPAVKNFFTKTIPSWFGRGQKATAQPEPQRDKLVVPPELIAAKEQAERARREAQIPREAVHRQIEEATLQREAELRNHLLADVHPPQEQLPVMNLDFPPPNEPPPPPPDIAQPQTEEKPTRPASFTPGKFTEEEKSAMQRAKKEALSFFRDLEQKVGDKVINKPKGSNKK